MRSRREYLQLLEKAKLAADAAIDAFNRVNNPYRNESTLILLTNAWELLAKAVLVQKRQSIRKDNRGNTIAAEIAVARLKNQGLLDENQERLIQQVISLRHAAIHHVLPNLDSEILHHLLYFSCKFFRDTLGKVFRGHTRDLKGNYLSLAFSELTTYADKVQKLVARVKKSPNEKKAVWLLERGVKFDGTQYLTEKQFERQFQGRKRIMPHLSLNEFIKSADMVRIVPILAPRNYTADITLRKGSARDSSLPVLVKRTELEADYPYLTKELAEKLQRPANFVAAATAALGLKGNRTYHQPIRAARSTIIQRYSEAALSFLVKHLEEHPNFNPYHALQAQTPPSAKLEG